MKITNSLIVLFVMCVPVVFGFCLYNVVTALIEAQTLHNNMVKVCSPFASVNSFTDNDQSFVICKSPEGYVIKEME